MRIFLLSSIAIILSVSKTFGQVLENTIINGVTKTNGKIYYQERLFNGYLYGNYETGQIKYKYQVVEGIPNGYYYQYYKDQYYNPDRYQDSSKISTIQNKLVSETKVFEQLIKDSIISSRKLSEYYAQEIKTDKKLAALKEKSIDGKLKGKNKEVYDAYVNLLNNHQNIKRDIKSSSQKISDFGTLLNNEKSKKVFVPIVELNYNQLNLVKNGTFKSYHPNGKLKELGDYQNNFKVGKWLTYYDNGREQNVGGYDKGEELNPEKGKIGEWYYCNTSGQPILIEKRDANGSVISKVTNQYHSNGKLEKEITTNRSGINEGIYKEYYSNGNLKTEGTYKSGFQNGPWVYYYENGKIKAKGNFTNGNGSDPGSTGIPRNNRNGEWYLYEENGNISQINNWKNGIQFGEQIVYENGKKSKIHLWDNGVLKSTKILNSSGKIEILQEFSDTKQRNFKQTEYFEASGKIHKELTYVNGKQHGQQKVFYENGKLEISAITDTNSTVNDNFIELKQFDENGTLSLHQAVSNGQWVDKLANTTNQTNTNNTSSNTTISKTEINQKYKCKCCKATINGLTDGVDESGGEYSDWDFNYYNKIYGSPEMRELYKKQAELYNNLPMLVGGGEKMSSEFNVYQMLRGNFKYCSLKCAKVCAED